ncbi:PAS domain S-box protein [uncultured Methylobacterium sp.]|uniref:PAS domain S-box protein n=1 Tax=uncultured Methylobacterium sp. TaxID=157278 RepID=UPI0035CAFE1D
MTASEIEELRRRNRALEAEAARLRELAAAGQRHRIIFDSTTDFALVAMDRDGRVTDWNAGAERVLGWSAREMLGEPADRFFTPEDRAADRVATEMRLARETGRAGDDRWHLRKDGARFWASGEMVPLRAPDGAHLGYLKILRDRTAEHLAGVSLREAEARLRESEDHYRHTVELNPQVPWTADPHGNVTSYSRRWLDLTGQAEGEPDGAGWIAAIHPDDVAHTRAVFAACLASGEPVDVDYRIRVAATGTYRWMRARARPRRDAAGAIVRWYGVVEDVHEARCAEEGLRVSEARYRSLFEAIDVGFCVIDMIFDATGRPTDYRFVESNPAFARQAGFEPLPGQRIREIAPAHEQHWFDTYGRVARTGEPAYFDDHAQALGRWFDVHAFRVGDPALGRVGVLFTDVTRRRRDELALRESEARFRIFAQALPNHVWSASPDGRLEWANDVTYAYSGGSPDQTIGDTWTERVHPEDRPRVAARWASSLATGEIYETEFRVRRADGAYRWFLVRALPIRGPDGAVARWIGANTDIHDQRAASEVLARTNASLESQVAERTRERDRLWRNTQDIQVVIDGAGVFRAVSPAFTTILGWSPEEVIGQPLFVFVVPEDGALTEDALRHARQETLPTVENRYRHKDGGVRWISWVAAPEGALIYASGRHVTAEKERQAELAQAQEALRQAQKMEAVGQLTGGLAHDFNNLLAGISGSLELMQNRIAQGRLNDVDRYMAVAQGAAKRAAALTHRLLAFSRRQTLDPRPTNINRLVTGMEELIRRTVGPTIHMEVVGASGLWPALVDSHQLENALLNLCINARDAMPDGGRITIETANKWVDDHAARSHDMPPGPYLSVCVTDTGTGMSPDVIAKAFEPFFTTKPIGQGTGLGLSMIYGFARQSGGQVRIYSDLGQGTTMCLYLPRHDGETDEDGVQARPEAAPRAEQGETVLVVDDEPSVRMLVTEVLEDLGYTAIEAADSVAGLKVLHSDVRLDLLVTDVGLPGGMNGRQMADAGRAKRPGLKVLFITGYAENAVLGNDHLAPGMQVLTKPFVLDALAARIRDMIGS